MNTSLALIAAKALPALSGSSLTYNAEKNVYLTLGYTSAAGNTYYRAIRLSDRLAVYYHIGQGYAHTFLNGRDVEQEIRSMRVSDKVSPVSAIPFVRTAMVAAQQKMGERKGIVMDGRDIGTTVFPHAELKIFVTASAETRAQRRVDELQAKGVAVDFDEVVANINKRDHIDQTRQESPLRRADDAILLDNSHMTLDEQDAWLLARYEEAVAKQQ